MPCNSDYMNPSSKEIQLSQTACLLDELEGKPLNRHHWSGYHPLVYDQNINGDELVSTLCQKLQMLDVTKLSLEMQIWWRDHQIADKERLEKELQYAEATQQKQQALAKLTSYERKLLGLV